MLRVGFITYVMLVVIQIVLLIVKISGAADIDWVIVMMPAVVPTMLFNLTAIAYGIICFREGVFK